MTLKQAQQIIRHHQLSLEGFEDFAVTKKQLSEAMNAIATSSILANGVADAIKEIVVVESLDTRHEHDNPFIERNLSTRIALRLGNIIENSGCVQFEYTKTHVPALEDYVRHTVKGTMLAVNFNELV